MPDTNALVNDLLARGWEIQSWVENGLTVACLTKIVAVEENGDLDTRFGMGRGPSFDVALATAAKDATLAEKWKPGDPVVDSGGRG